LAAGAAASKEVFAATAPSRDEAPIVTKSGGHGVIEHVSWIDAPGDRAENTIAAAREAFRWH
jgi:hypothetical protein